MSDRQHVPEEHQAGTRIVLEVRVLCVAVVHMFDVPGLAELTAKSAEQKADQFSEYLATAYPTDTPSCASARAAALPSDVRLRQRLQPMHIFEVHDLESYVELVWSGCRIRRA